MKKVPAGRSVFRAPRALGSLAFCAIAVSLSLLAFALYPGGTALAQNQTTMRTLTGPLQAPCTSTFANPAPITINDAAPAAPYPSTLAVAGFSALALPSCATNDSMIYIIGVALRQQGSCAVKADLNTLEGLYAWKLVGGELNPGRDAPVNVGATAPVAVARTQDLMCSMPVMGPWCSAL
jgi:hypothetical protein